MTAIHTWEITDHRKVNGQNRNIQYLPAVTDSGYSWWNGKRDEWKPLTVSLAGWEVNEEEQWKILLSTEEISLKPAREKCGGVWGRRRAVLWWWLVAFRITGRSQHMWAPLLCPANMAPHHRPYSLIVAGRSAGGCTVGKTLTLLGGELPAPFDYFVIPNVYQ